MMKICCRAGLYITLAALAYIIVGCGPQATQIPVVLTVVHTIPVEVTKVVEITRQVEVTREVVVTQAIQVPITVTPEVLRATQTPVPNPTYAVNMTLETPQATPLEKGTGYTPVFVYNQTKNKIGLDIIGPTTMSLTLWPGDVQKIWLPEGIYKYTVWANDQKSYDGGFKIVNPDKHQFFINDKKAVLWGP
jgi:hypothetical protein